MAEIFTLLGLIPEWPDWAGDGEINDVAVRGGRPGSGLINWPLDKTPARHLYWLTRQFKLGPFNRKLSLQWRVEKSIIVYKIAQSSLLVKKGMIKNVFFLIL